MFELNIVTPNRKLVENAEMTEVFVPAHRGELNIFPGHAPLMSTLTEGVLKYQLKDSGTIHAVAISWGYLEITPKGVNILAETAEEKEEIDVARAEEALKKAEAALHATDITPEDIEKNQRKRKRAEARITVAKFH